MVYSYFQRSRKNDQSGGTIIFNSVKHINMFKHINILICKKDSYCIILKWISWGKNVINSVK